VLTTSSLAAAVLPAGPLLLAVLLLVGFAALGLFPAYYSFSQELTVEHQGKLTGALGCICWMAMALLHEVVPDVAGRTGSYSAQVGAAGLLPLVGVAPLLLLWGRAPASAEEAPAATKALDAVQAEAIQPAGGHILPPPHRPWTRGTPDALDGPGRPAGK
jgi:hypothetical protein